MTHIGKPDRVERIEPLVRPRPLTKPAKPEKEPPAPKRERREPVPA